MFYRSVENASSREIIFRVVPSKKSCPTAIGSNESIESGLFRICCLNCNWTSYLLPIYAPSIITMKVGMHIVGYTHVPNPLLYIKQMWLYLYLCDAIARTKRLVGKNFMCLASTRLEVLCGVSFICAQSCCKKPKKLFSVITPSKIKRKLK